jgi:hypothetical protein
LVGTEKMDNTNNCNSYTNDDCIILYGKDAFCKNEQCYCNRQSSFMDNQKCGMSSKRIISLSLHSTSLLLFFLRIVFKL